MSKQPQPIHDDLIHQTKMEFCELTNKSGQLVFASYQTAVIGQGRSAKVYDAACIQYPNQKFVIRITESKLFPNENILFAFEAVVASGQFTEGRKLRHISLLKKGLDLEKYLRSIQGFLRSDQEIYRLSIAVARAGYELHRHDIAHRDIKPANFILLRDGRVLMVDPDLAESNIKIPSEMPNWGTHGYWRIGDTKEEVDLWALLRTLYVPHQLECQYLDQEHTDENCGALKTKLWNREELQSFPSGNSFFGIIPDYFFENNQRAKLKECLSTEKLVNTQRFQSAGQLLCGLILSRYGLFEIFNTVPAALEKLVLDYQDRDPECMQLASKEVREIITKIAQSPVSDNADIEKLKELFLSSVYASSSVTFLRAKNTQTQSDKNTFRLQAKL